MRMGKAMLILYTTHYELTDCNLNIIINHFKFYEKSQTSRILIYIQAWELKDMIKVNDTREVSKHNTTYLIVMVLKNYS